MESDFSRGGCVRVIDLLLKLVDLLIMHPSFYHSKALVPLILGLKHLRERGYCNLRGRGCSFCPFVWRSEAVVALGRRVYS